jgi:predicted RNase H-like nuclease (RuvC/YqgF family)
VQAAGGAAKTGDAAKAVEAAKTGDATKTEDPNGQTAWRRRFQTQRDKITKAEKELEILGRELEKAQMEYYPDPQKAMKQQNSRADINAINAKIDAKKKEVAQLQQGLDDMEEQLRKSGGDPGWAR